MITVRGIYLRKFFKRPQIGSSSTAELFTQHPTTSLTMHRNSTHFRSGAVKPMPNLMPFGMLATALTIIPGLFVGAMISKHVANFLEENDLFVPADDDDDDD